MTTPLSDLVDKAYDIHCAELDHWRLIDMGNNLFTAVRSPQPYGLAKPSASPVAEDGEIRRENFSDKSYATAFIQWEALKAVLSSPEIQSGLAALDA